MIKKIKELSKVFIKEYFENLDIFNKDTKKLNKKSMYTWMLLITMIAIKIPINGAILSPPIKIAGRHKHRNERIIPLVRIPYFL